MPHSLQIIRTSDFLRLNSQGKFDLEASRQALQGVARACIEQEIDGALLDVRNASSDMTMAELYQLALAFRELGFRKNHCLAILYRSRAGARVDFFSMAPGERAEFFATCAAEQGWNVGAFDDYEQAMEWFATELPVEAPK